MRGIASQQSRTQCRECEKGIGVYSEGIVLDEERGDSREGIIV